MHWLRKTLTTEVPPHLRLRDLHGRDVIVIAEAILLLPIVQLGVRVAGLQRTAEWAGRLVGRRIGLEPAVWDAPKIQRIAQLVRASCRRWPIGATCLDRSLVTMVLLGRRRIPVTICIGFHKGEGVEGHAWVEHNAIPLAETTDLTAMSRQMFTWHRRQPPRQVTRKSHTSSNESPG